jgi:hypothetical protein
MGIYKLSYEEIKESLEDFLVSLEGDFNAEDIAKAFNSIAKKENWPERFKTTHNKNEKTRIR